MVNKFVNESALSMRREKPKSIYISLLYFLTRTSKRIFGEDTILRFYLNSSWVFWRMAFEFAGVVYGGEFHNQAKALNEEFLRKQLNEDESLIDIGCGVGRWCKVASKYSHEVVGIDYDKELILQACEQNGNSQIKYIVGDVTKDLDNKKFDVALLIHVIEHIENSDKLLRDLHGVCRRLIIEVPDFEHDPLNWARLKQGCPFYTDGDHVREYTEAILNDQLKRTGWKALETRKNGGSVLIIAEQ